jgi:endonuclease-3 related protein
MTGAGSPHSRQAILLAIYDRLYAAYGPQHWWPADSPFEIIVGAILTQATSWSNVEKAIANLKAASVLSPDSLYRIPSEELARLLFPAGYHRSKAAKLKAFAAMLHEGFAGSLELLLALPTSSLRARLLATYGIGPETADAILLYAASRPVFVIDAYTRRTFRRLGIAPDHDSYDAWQSFFTYTLPADTALFNEYHALIVSHAKQTCRKIPECAHCPLQDVCAYGCLTA